MNTKVISNLKDCSGLSPSYSSFCNCDSKFICSLYLYSFLIALALGSFSMSAWDESKLELTGSSILLNLTPA